MAYSIITCSAEIEVLKLGPWDSFKGDPNTLEVNVTSCVNEYMWIFSEKFDIFTRRPRTKKL